MTDTISNRATRYKDRFQRLNSSYYKVFVIFIRRYTYDTNNRRILVRFCFFFSVPRKCTEQRFRDRIFNVAFNAASEKFAFTFFPGLARFDLANFSARSLARITVHAKSVLLFCQRRRKSTGGWAGDGVRDVSKAYSRWDDRDASVVLRLVFRSRKIWHIIIRHIGIFSK